MPELVLNTSGAKFSWDCPVCMNKFTDKLDKCPICILARERDIWQAKFVAVEKELSKYKKAEQLY